MISAIRDDDPVVLFNNRQLMGISANVHVPEEAYEFPIGKARILREGDDVTLVGIGYHDYIAEQAADALADDGISAEVVDLLSTSPMDERPSSNRCSGRARW